MSAAWAAGAARARSLARRAVGPDVARQVAAAGSVPAAVEVLRATPTGTTSPPVSRWPRPKGRSSPPSCGTCACSPGGCPVPGWP